MALPKRVEFNQAAHAAAHDLSGGRLLRWQSAPAPGISIGGEEYPMADTAIYSWMIATMDDEDAPADITAELVLAGATLDSVTLASGKRVSDVSFVYSAWRLSESLVISITDDGGLVGRLSAHIRIAGL